MTTRSSPAPVTTIITPCDSSCSPVASSVNEHVAKAHRRDDTADDAEQRAARRADHGAHRWKREPAPGVAGQVAVRDRSDQHEAGAPYRVRARGDDHRAPAALLAGVGGEAAD